MIARHQPRDQHKLIAAGVIASAFLLARTCNRIGDIGSPVDSWLGSRRQLLLRALRQRRQVEAAGRMHCLAAGRCVRDWVGPLVNAADAPLTFSAALFDP